MKLIIGYLYGDLMNIYGDTGNIICLKKRCEWRGIEVEVKNISVGDKLKPRGFDMYFFGGGQDQAQTQVAGDLTESGKGKVVREEVERGVPMLSICGGYQLLGKFYQPFEGKKLDGVGIFPAYTKASNDRMIGNIVIKPSAFSLQLSAKNKYAADSRQLIADSYLVGFENHSGKTFLENGAKPLGKVIKGSGNNSEDGTEGCIYKNAIGCYMHGSLLPKNPQLADWLIQKALEIKYEKKVKLKPLGDELENKAHDFAVKEFS
ncbi:glutamine amidotransferase [Candidatus Daviesbacteria bacterium]|nr:glutamine amidotransferase [Candidatus Daviesbacteria bacterium]